MLKDLKFSQADHFQEVNKSNNLKKRKGFVLVIEGT
jgi:hypothetical protein